ncbi:MAG: hypothetical protein A2Y76_00780 [Planctomycetes bacterium RBG_13_60_9]|nr:MAG: hypothetical protein A2Y76_00780 [Planctomycetes bacterium RBG_13_60_9]
MTRFTLRLMVLSTVFAFCASVSAEDGVLNLGPEEIIKAKGSDIIVPGYSVPAFEDWNNDLLKDLLVGEGGGSVPGKVRIYLNVGTESDPCFVDYFYAQAEGKDLSCPPQGCLGCFPRVVDWDEDGRKDLLVGLADGTVKIFRNITDNNEPVFDAGTNIKVGNENAFNLDVGSRAMPIAVQWNDDGMLDLVVGGLDGLIHVYYNCGCGGSVPPRFYLSPVAGMLVQEKERDLMVPSGRSSPVVMDLDGDGKKDLLTGNTDGLVLFYKNLGTDSLPVFSGYTLVQSNGLPIDLAGTLRTRPFVCHWTGAKDGYWDLLLGYGDGKVRLYRGIPKLGDLDADGVLDGDDLTLLAKAMNKPVPPEGSPADLNGDGIVDILDLSLFADLWLAEHDPQPGAAAPQQ